MLTEESTHHLARYYNMSIYSFRIPGTNLNRDYLLEVNPHYINPTEDLMNLIDARWIDVRAMSHYHESCYQSHVCDE